MISNKLKILSLAPSSDLRDEMQEYPDFDCFRIPNLWSNKDITKKEIYNGR